MQQPLSRGVASGSAQLKVAVTFTSIAAYSRPLARWPPKKPDYLYPRNSQSVQNPASANCGDWDGTGSARESSWGQNPNSPGD